MSKQFEEHIMGKKTPSPRKITNKTLFHDVQDFHKKFKVPVNKTPTQLPRKVMEFRTKFMEEEYEELLDAYRRRDLAGQFDALIDLVYVILGTADMMGLKFDKGWDLVHQANMKKVRAKSAKQSKRGHSYDVVKPEGWEAPDLTKLVKKKKPVKKAEGHIFND